MAMATIFIDCVFFVLSDSVCQGLPGKQNTLVVFGDSVFDRGKNKGNSLPYEETYFVYPTGRVSDGRIVPDFIACSDNPNAWNGSQAVRRHFVGWVVAHIISAVEDIYKLGGKKFAFQNSGPLGLAPAFKAFSKLGGCAQECTLMARLHNRALPIALQNLEKKLPEPIKYGIFDFYNTLGDRAKNPTKYGFKVGNASCCGVGRYNCGFDCSVLNRPYKNYSNSNKYVV